MRSLLLSMIAKRLAILAFINICLGILLITNLGSEAKISVAVLLIFVDLMVGWLLVSQYKKILRASEMPFQLAQVKMKGNTLRTIKGPSEWQTASIVLTKQNNPSEKESDLDVEIGVSSVGLPNMTDSFEAQVFFDGSKPVLLFSEKSKILATINGVVSDRRAFS